MTPCRIDLAIPMYKYILHLQWPVTEAAGCLSDAMMIF